MNGLRAYALNRSRMGAYDMLLKAVQDGHFFKRNKIALETKVLVACLLYMTGLSYGSMTLQTGIIPSLLPFGPLLGSAAAQERHIEGPKEGEAIRRNR
jgi:hypothetical protein